MLKWVKKKILKSIINDIIKELPTYIEKIKGIAISFIKSKLG